MLKVEHLLRGKREGNLFLLWPLGEGFFAVWILLSSCGLRKSHSSSLGRGILIFHWVLWAIQFMYRSMTLQLSCVSVCKKIHEYGLTRQLIWQRKLYGTAHGVPQKSRHWNFSSQILLWATYFVGQINIVARQLILSFLPTMKVLSLQSKPAMPLDTIHQGKVLKQFVKKL